MIGERTTTDLNTRIEHPGRIEALLHPDKQIVQLRAEHRLDIFSAYPAITMFSANRTAEAVQHGVVNLVIALHHLLKIALIVDIEQGNDMGVSIPDMTENGDGYMLPSEELFQIPYEFADPFSRHDHIIDKVNRLLLGIEPIERGIERLAGLP